MVIEYILQVILHPARLTKSKQLATTLGPRASTTISPPSVRPTVSTIIHFRQLCASICLLVATQVPCLTYSYSDALCATIPYCMVDTVSLNCVDCTTGPCGPSTTPCSQLNSTLCASLSSRCQWFSGNSTFVSIVVLLQSIILNDSSQMRQPALLQHHCALELHGFIAVPMVYGRFLLSWHQFAQSFNEGDRIHLYIM